MATAEPTRGNSFLDKIGLADVLTRIKNAFVAKADTQEVQFLDIDSTPTANSTNLVTSGGVAGALAGKQDTIVDLANIRSGSQDNVKYSSQSLTDSQKLQARTNIGAMALGDDVLTITNQPPITSPSSSTTLATVLGVSAADLQLVFDGKKTKLHYADGNFHDIYTVITANSIAGDVYKILVLQKDTSIYMYVDDVDAGGDNEYVTVTNLTVSPGTLITNATNAQTASSGESMSGNITLHKVAKTGTYSDLIGTPTIPTVPTISTNIEQDKSSDAKTTSPKAVADYIDGKTGDLTNLNTTSNNNLVAAINELKSNSSNTYTVGNFWSIPDSILNSLEVGDTVIQDLELIGGSGGELLGTVVDCQDNYKAITSYDPYNGYYLYEYSRSDSLEEWSCSASSFPLHTIDGKADKVSGAVSGNLAGLDSYGNLTDSGYSASSFATSAQGTKADNAVQYIQQSLTDAQKTQARTNIGATAPEVFWVEYGTTTLQEVTNAYNAGKLVICKYQGKFYTLSTLTETYCYFTAVNNTAYYRLLLNGSNWSAGQGSLEVVGNKVTSLSSSSTDTQYPSAKLVYDSLAEKQDVIDANNKLDYSLIDNTPTIPIISTDIILDKTTDEKTASPKAVWDVIENTALLDDTTTFSYEPTTVATTKNGVISQTITWTNNQYTLSNQVYGSIPQSNIDLFENCGASFNDTGADVTVTDLYGRSFTHKAGCFMMNGLGDLSYQEILTAYNYANISQPYAAANGMPSPRPLESSPARTNFWTFTQNWNTQVSFYMFACYNHVSNLTTVRLRNNDSDVYTGAMRQAFTSASRVEYIYPAIECSSQTGTGSAANSFYGAFDNMANLKEIRLKSLKISLSFKNSPNLSMNSIKYMIDNETSTSAFTITLHATAYNAAIADSEIQTSLSNHTNVTLASA